MFKSTITCPYCGHESEIYVSNEFAKQIVNCGTDEGGCDGDFVAHSVVTVETKALRIEDEEQFAPRKDKP